LYCLQVIIGTRTTLSISAISCRSTSYDSY
jgi:hypothetical protein